MNSWRDRFCRLNQSDLNNMILNKYIDHLSFDFVQNNSNKFRLCKNSWDIVKDSSHKCHYCPRMWCCINTDLMSFYSEKRMSDRLLSLYKTGSKQDKTNNRLGWPRSTQCCRNNCLISSLCLSYIKYNLMNLGKLNN